MNTINIKCTFCGANLPLPKVVFKFGIPNLTCPYCKKTFKPTVETVEQVSHNLQQAAANTAGEGTVIIRKEDSAKAWLELKTNEGVKKYPITEIKNTIGRKSSTSPTGIQLEVDDRAMSRQHFQINKTMLQGDNVQYILSDANSCNNTFINTNGLMKINPDDEYVLQDGDVILAGETSITFRLTDSKPTIHSQSTVLIRKL